MSHWFEYEAPEIVDWFDVECDECLVVSCVEITANVWRDGTIFGSWDCPECGEGNSSEDISNVAEGVAVGEVN